MLFDTRTLITAVALASLFCTAARFLLWHRHPAIPGLARWAWAGAAATLALIMILFHGVNPWPGALSLAELFVFIGLVLSWDGFRRFLDRSPVPRPVLALLAGIVLVGIAVETPLHSLQIKAIGNAVLVAVLSALIARELLIAPKPALPAMQVTGWFYALNTVFFLIKAVAANPGAAPVAPLTPDGFAPFILFWWLCMTIAVTLGMVLMTTERLQVHLDKQANHDPLTGVLNRRAFSLIAEKTVAQSLRNDKPLSILMLDLDRFKQINDQLGHNSGDELLRRFVTVAGQVLRSEDIFCRFGGEEFVALLPDAAADQALMAAERLRSAFAAASRQSVKDILPFDITVSIGVAELELDEDIESLLHRADAALYQAKDRGRNCCELAENNQAIADSGNPGYLAAE